MFAHYFGSTVSSGGLVNGWKTSYLSPVRSPAMPSEFDCESPCSFICDTGVPQFHAAREYLAREKFEAKFCCFTRSPIHSQFSADYKGHFKSPFYSQPFPEVYAPRSYETKNEYSHKYRMCTRRCSARSPVLASTAATSFDNFEEASYSSNAFRNRPMNLKESSTREWQGTPTPVLEHMRSNFLKSCPSKIVEKLHEPAYGLVGDELGLCFSNVSRSIDKRIQESLLKPLGHKYSNAQRRAFRRNQTCWLSHVETAPSCECKQDEETTQRKCCGFLSGSPFLGGGAKKATEVGNWETSRESSFSCEEGWATAATAAAFLAASSKHTEAPAAKPARLALCTAGTALQLDPEDVEAFLQAKSRTEEVAARIRAEVAAARKARAAPKDTPWSRPCPRKSAPKTAIPQVASGACHVSGKTTIPAVEIKSPFYRRCLKRPHPRRVSSARCSNYTGNNGLYRGSRAAASPTAEIYRAHSASKRPQKFLIAYGVQMQPALLKGQRSPLVRSSCNIKECGIAADKNLAAAGGTAVNPHGGSPPNSVLLNTFCVTRFVSSDKPSLSSSNPAGERQGIASVCSHFPVSPKEAQPLPLGKSKDLADAFQAQDGTRTDTKASSISNFLDRHAVPVSKREATGSAKAAASQSHGKGLRAAFTAIAPTTTTSEHALANAHPSSKPAKLQTCATSSPPRSPGTESPNLVYLKKDNSVKKIEKSVGAPANMLASQVSSGTSQVGAQPAGYRHLARALVRVSPSLCTLAVCMVKSFFGAFPPSG